MRRCILGIDVGGTNIKLGLVDLSGRIIGRSHLSTESCIRTKGKLIEAIIASCQNIVRERKLHQKEILGIGIGLPGLVDNQRGVVRFLTNIPGWKDVPLRKILQQKLRKPVFIDNDVNLITLGEWKYGAGRGIENLLCLTLGTGVGGGLILNNILYRGKGFFAGEIGHLPLGLKGPQCNCGGIACLEAYIGNQRLLKEAKKIFRDKEISLEKVNQLARGGNSKALKFWHEIAVYLGLGLVSVVNLLNPQRIIVGGGLANASRFLLETLKATIRKRALNIPAGQVKIVRAQLGDEAGILGAQVLVERIARIK